MYVFLRDFCAMTRKDIDLLHPIHQWHQPYIRLTDDLPVLEVLASHQELFNANERQLLEKMNDLTYAPGKWTVRDILQHLSDTERILSYRALRIARNDQTPLPGFDEDSFSRFTNASHRSITSLLDEFGLVVQGTVALFESFDMTMLRRTGICSGVRISAFALGYIIAGHALHHRQMLRERYFPLLSSGSF